MQACGVRDFSILFWCYNHVDIWPYNSLLQGCEGQMFFLEYLFRQREEQIQIGVGLQEKHEMSVVNNRFVITTETIEIGELSS